MALTIKRVFCNPFVFLLLFLFCYNSPKALDEQDTMTSQKVRCFDYAKDQVYPLTLKIGYQLIVEFHEDEVIKTISSGNQYAWSITVLGNRLLIKPLEDAIITNAFVLTNERSYHFEVRSDSSIDNNKLDYVVKFDYTPKNDKKKFPDFRQFFDNDALLNYRYTFVSRSDFEPKRICDNGKNTHVYMDRTIYLDDIQVWVNKENDVVLVPGYVDEDQYSLYIEGVHKHITIVIGKDRVDIYKL